jgi:hypothetical protein
VYWCCPAARLRARSRFVCGGDSAERRMVQSNGLRFSCAATMAGAQERAQMYSASAASAG